MEVVTHPRHDWSCTIFYPSIYIFLLGLIGTSIESFQEWSVVSHEKETELVVEEREEKVRYIYQNYTVESILFLE
jgi:hypothetical protein